MAAPQTDTRKNREDARAALLTKIEGLRRNLDDPRSFSTIDPNYLIQDAEFRLRWIDCAPEGACHCVAPGQDKNGIPMGITWDENPGAGKNLREARVARGLHPLTGQGVQLPNTAENRAAVAELFA